MGTDRGTPVPTYVSSEDCEAAPGWPHTDCDSRVLPKPLLRSPMPWPHDSDRNRAVASLNVNWIQVQSLRTRISDREHEGAVGNRRTEVTKIVMF